MYRRSFPFRLLNVSGEGPSPRAKPMRHLLLDVQSSPYKETFKDFWATPVPWAAREHGPKPILGAPIPTRRAAAAIVVGRNRHFFSSQSTYSNPNQNEDQYVESKYAGVHDNDYKVLMMFREGKGQFVKDQFIFPSYPVSMEDCGEDWERLLTRKNVVTKWEDLPFRLTAMRALFAYANILLIPKEGGGLAEVEGPPGPRKWHLIVHSFPKAMRHLIDILDMSMESALSQLIPFRRILTPETESFRFDNLNYIIPFDKIPDLRFTISTVGERLVWVSPMEAMARFNAGIMNMPTPNLIALSELHNECPTFADIQKKASNPYQTPPAILPELCRHEETKVATVLLPGDLFHSSTTEEQKKDSYVRRFVYEKDYPWGVRAVFDERPATNEEEKEPLVKEKPILLEEATEMDMVYADTPYQRPLQRPISKEGKTMFPLPELRLPVEKDDDDVTVPVENAYMPTSGTYIQMLPPKDVYSAIVNNKTPDTIEVEIDYELPRKDATENKVVEKKSIPASDSFTFVEKTGDMGTFTVRAAIKGIKVQVNGEKAELQAPFPGVVSPVQNYHFTVEREGTALKITGTL